MGTEPEEAPGMNWARPFPYFKIDTDVNWDTIPSAAEFGLLAPRIVHLLRRMETWRPRTFREMFIPGYATRMDWWVAMFAIAFGVVSVLGLGIGVYQLYLGQRQLSVALEALVCQR